MRIEWRGKKAKLRLSLKIKLYLQVLIKEAYQGKIA